MCCFSSSLEFRTMICMRQRISQQTSVRTLILDIKQFVVNCSLKKKHTCYYRLVNKTYSNTLIIINLRTLWISKPIQIQHIRLTVNVAPIMTWIPKLLSAGISQRAIITLPSNNTINNAM